MTNQRKEGVKEKCLKKFGNIDEGRKGGARRKMLCCCRSSGKVLTCKGWSFVRGSDYIGGGMGTG